MSFRVSALTPAIFHYVFKRHVMILLHVLAFWKRDCSGRLEAGIYWYSLLWSILRGEAWLLKTLKAKTGARDSLQNWTRTKLLRTVSSHNHSRRSFHKIMGRAYFQDHATNRDRCCSLWRHEEQLQFSSYGCHWGPLSVFTASLASGHGEFSLYKEKKISCYSSPGYRIFHLILRTLTDDFQWRLLERWIAINSLQNSIIIFVVLEPLN